MVARRRAHEQQLQQRRAHVVQRALAEPRDCEGALEHLEIELAPPGVKCGRLGATHSHRHCRGVAPHRCVAQRHVRIASCVVSGCLGGLLHLRPLPTVCLAPWPLLEGAWRRRRLRRWQPQPPLARRWQRVERCRGALAPTRARGGIRCVSVIERDGLALAQRAVVSRHTRRERRVGGRARLARQLQPALQRAPDHVGRVRDVGLLHEDKVRIVRRYIQYRHARVGQERRKHAHHTRCCTRAEVDLECSPGAWSVGDGALVARLVKCRLAVLIHHQCDPFFVVR
mmetsp:Transcript_11740/g.30631  ORF Transcript_11740/g.30631 Transcript_11740/m.30631 type:complete len:284 (-) Transcript_11740:260-1111(-)